MLPATPTEKWLKSLDSVITQFYWEVKRSKILTNQLQYLVIE